MTYRDFLKQGRQLGKRDRIEEFLNHILYLAKHNKMRGIRLNTRIVYQELKRYGVNVDTDLNSGNTLKNIKDEGMFESWTRSLADYWNVDTTIDDRRNYQFYKIFNKDTKLSNTTKKIYLSIDHDHLYEGINQITKFLFQNRMTYMIQIPEEVRSDNVSIILNGDDLEGEKKLTSFLKNNEYLRFGKNVLNPFIPLSDGVACVNNLDANYNLNTASLICDFINQNQDKDIVDIYGFKDYVDHYQKGSRYCNLLLMENLLETLQKSNTNKMGILYQAVVCSIEKHGVFHAAEAVKRMVHFEDPSYFSVRLDEEPIHVNYRAQVASTLKSEDIIDIIDRYYKNLYPGYDLSKISLDDKIVKYVNDMAYEFKKSLLNRVCLNTYRKYNSSQVIRALNNYVQVGRAKDFTRYDYDTNNNYREKLIGNIEPNEVIPLLNGIIYDMGGSLDTINYQNIINFYVDSLPKQLGPQM